MTEKLTAIIDEIVQTKTLSLGAIDAVKELKDKYEAASKQVETLGRQLTASEKLVCSLQDSSRKSYEQVAEQAKTIAEFKNKEAAFFEQGVQTKYAELRRQDALDIVKLVFKSPVFRADIQKSDNCSTGYISGSRTVTQSEE